MSICNWPLLVNTENVGTKDRASSYGHYQLLWRTASQYGLFSIRNRPRSNTHNSTIFAVSIGTKTDRGR